MRASFHPEAHAEMIEQARYYEAKSEGLGSDFLSAVEEATQRILLFPKSRPNRPSKHSQAACLRLSFHYSLRGAAGSNLHRRRDASTSPAGLLARADRISAGGAGASG